MPVTTMSLPQDLMDALIWPRVHELRLRPVLNDLLSRGISCIEDLPDLLSLTQCVSWNDPPERPGWSTRVTEVLHEGPRNLAQRAVARAE